MSQTDKIKNHTNRVIDRCKSGWNYFNNGIWADTRQIWYINILKTLNLSVRSFLSADIQSKACALTYRTLLALVPALALLFAIGRGFGLQDILEQELQSEFSSQGEFLEHILNYVNSYLDNSSEGIFVGVGVIVLLWTLISLLSAVEHVFNRIWGIVEDRSFWRKCTDYLAIFLILPILIVCASGITVFMSTTVESALPFSFITPMMGTLLDIASFVLVWLFFAGCYMLIPNTKVKFKNAMVAGILAGTGFTVLQWLFITGTVYVSKYNAIYGSVAFIPLFLIWMQLVWVITLAGALICYSSQNIFQFNFNSEITKISTRYRLKITLAIMTVTVDNFEKKNTPPTESDISLRYGIPISLVSKSVNSLIDAGLLLRVVNNPKVQVYGFVPSVDPEKLTVGYVIEQLRTSGTQEFVPGFNDRFSEVINCLDHAEKSFIDVADDTLIRDLIINEISNS